MPNFNKGGDFKLAKEEQGVHRLHKIDLIREYAKRLDINISESKYAINVFYELLEECIEEYDEVKIGDIVKLKKVDKPETTVVLNGNIINTPPYTTVKPVISKKYKKIIIHEFEGGI